MDAEPKRIQRKRTRGWKMPENTAAVDRSTGFGNPFAIHKQKWTCQGKPEIIYAVGSLTSPALWLDCKTKRDAQARAADAFRSWINLPQQERLRTAAKLVLRGKNQACWCGLCDQHKDGRPLGITCPDCEPCHADVLLELANESTPGEG